MNIQDCIERSLLKSDSPDLEKSRRSIETAMHKIEIAEKELKAEIYENALTTAYSAMFHAARALLYKDGFKERSHFALCVFVNEKYGSVLEKRFLYAINSLREKRHEVMYGIESDSLVHAGEATTAVATAKEFIQAVKKLVG